MIILLKDSVPTYLIRWNWKSPHNFLLDYIKHQRCSSFHTHCHSIKGSSNWSIVNLCYECGNKYTKLHWKRVLFTLSILSVITAFASCSKFWWPVLSLQNYILHTYTYTLEFITKLMYCLPSPHLHTVLSILHTKCCQTNCGSTGAKKFSVLQHSVIELLTL